MNNKGKRVKLIGEFAENFDCTIGTITDTYSHSYHVLLDNGVYCQPLKETEPDAECELIEDDREKEVPTSKVGDRVMLTGKYAERFPLCRKGIINEINEGHYCVILDNGDNAFPFKETHSTPQCELISDKSAKEVRVSNIGKRVRLIGDFAKGFNCLTGTITDVGYVVYKVLLDDGIHCEPYFETEYIPECELIEEEPTKEVPQSNVGKRVRLIGDYAQVHSCVTGIIWVVDNDIYGVLLDNGVHCQPLKETAINAQCELISDDPAKEIPQSNVGKRVKLIGQYGEQFKCKTGIITAAWSKTYEVLLDEGILCEPFKETEPDSECELIVEESEQYSIKECELLDLFASIALKSILADKSRKFDASYAYKIAGMMIDERRKFLNTKD